MSRKIHGINRNAPSPILFHRHASVLPNAKQQSSLKAGGGVTLCLPCAQWEVTAL